MMEIYGFYWTEKSKKSYKCNWPTGSQANEAYLIALLKKAIGVCASPTWADHERLLLLKGVGALPDPNPLDATGSIRMAGSSTVFPLSETIGTAFIDEGFRYRGDVLSIDSIGTGGGFSRFCVAGESEIVNASRAIKPEEQESCEGIGRYPLEFQVGTDALAVVPP